MTQSSNQLRILSGVQPTGKIHIGNYVGALSLWVENQDMYDNMFCVVDMHALTIPEAVSPRELRRKTREVAALYMACGVDPAKSTIFVQSDVSQHAELCWVLTCTTPLGWLHRMTQFKAKSDCRESVSSGLLTYPVLQAADILIYEVDRVPVGEDQRQHIELTREIAQRFNTMFTPVFKLPEPLIRAEGARIMALDDPERKMSKSVGETVVGHSIGLLDEPATIRKAITRAVTDAGKETRFEHASPGVRNLLTLYKVLSGEEAQSVEARFEGQGYGKLKKDTAELVIETLQPVQTRWKEVMADVSTLDSILSEGAARARAIAEPMLARAKDAVGLGA